MRALILEEGQYPKGDLRRDTPQACRAASGSRGSIMDIDITKRITGNLRKLRQDIPDTMKAFSALAQAATRDGALDKQSKELFPLRT
jgi:alkylhydroperoxidase/carboxymuconolactone decarboxylase family protein YurZ